MPMNIPEPRSGLVVARVIPLLVLLLLTAAAPLRGEQLTASASSPEALPKVLADGAATLQRKIEPLSARLRRSQEQLAQTQQDLKDLQIAVASLRAALAVEQPPLTQVQELLAAYLARDDQAKERAEALAAESAALKMEVAAGTVAQNTLRNQVDLLQAASVPAATSPELQEAMSQYLQLADRRDRLASQVWENLDRTRQLLDRERQLWAGLLPELKKLEEAWKTELLQRPPSRLSLREQLIRLLANLAALPGQGWDRLAALVASGGLQSFLLGHLTHLLGLAAFLVLLCWGTRRLHRLTVRRFREWRVKATDLDLLPFYLLGRTLMDSAFRLGLILWVGIIFWNFNLWSTKPALLALYLLGGWWVLMLALAVVQDFFAGKAKDGVLPLGPATARFYRRSLKAGAVYLVLGFTALKCAPLLNFPEASRLFAEHVFLASLLVWVLWLLRRPYLSRLQPVLPDPRWVRRPAVGRVLKGVVIFLLAATILADLLGLSNLAVYVAQAATWSGLALVSFWFLWLAGETIIRHLLHPEQGWAGHRYPAREEWLQKAYSFSRLLLSIVLGTVVIFWSLNAWGVPPEQAARAFQWLTWGPSLGPLKLSPLNVGAAALALYLGFWLSRLVRSLMDFRIFPRTGLDSGVQYTITTMLHYVVLILAGLVALSLLGFSLTNLALVAGALGVGIGFGLQNIVNNFISGLILLFERPIKVGDLLVIDGQWGTVKEIRVRSTLFETLDRSVLIIPNSELISGKVLNWTHFGRGLNRLALKVGVAYHSDVRQVTQLLTDVCRNHPKVLDDPPPQIGFSAYGDNALDFTIWVYLRNPRDRVAVTHELNSAILETFQQHGIEIPFPQRDPHLKDWPAPPPEK